MYTVAFRMSWRISTTADGLRSRAVRFGFYGWSLLTAHLLLARDATQEVWQSRTGSVNQIRLRTTSTGLGPYPFKEKARFGGWGPFEFLVLPPGPAVWLLSNVHPKNPTLQPRLAPRLRRVNPATVLAPEPASGGPLRYFACDPITRPTAVPRDGYLLPRLTACRLASAADRH